MTGSKTTVDYSFKEEVFNAITHYIGVIFGIVSLIVLLMHATKNHSVVQVVAFSIYGGCLILLFLSSSIYHSIPNKKAKLVFRVIDHLSIYIFIAGTYTPIILLSFTGAKRIVFLATIWVLALSGIVFKLIIHNKFTKFNKISTIIYLILGWLSIFLIKTIYETTGVTFVILLVLGGILYSVGSFFYINKKIPYNHGIWHIFVLLAAIIHFIGILFAYAI